MQGEGDALGEGGEEIGRGDLRVGGWMSIASYSPIFFHPPTHPPTHLPTYLEAKEGGRGSEKRVSPSWSRRGGGGGGGGRGGGGEEEILHLLVEKEGPWVRPTHPPTPSSFEQLLLVLEDLPCEGRLGGVGGWVGGWVGG